MIAIPDEFTFEDTATDIVYGRGSVDRIGPLLDDLGTNRAMVVTGSHVGANTGVMDPLTAALGDPLVAVFDETTPAKLGETVFDGIERMQRESIDVIVGVGGGSSLDIARQISVFAADGRSLEELRAAAMEGNLSPPEPGEASVPVVVVPTTFAGADLSSGGSIEILGPAESPSGGPVRTGGSVDPEAVVYDPDLFETTPMGALAGSAMNGFDKGIETIYARTASPITDATAVRGLRLLRDALPRLPDDADAMDRAVVGMILVQYERRASIVHAFGHGFAERYDVQQGVVHGVVVPHVLRYLFEQVDARRSVLAEGFAIDAATMDDAAVAEAIIDAVEGVRDSLDLPTRLRDLDPVREADLPAIAGAVIDDRMMPQAPSGLDPSVDDIENVLRTAW